MSTNIDTQKTFAMQRNSSTKGLLHLAICLMTTLASSAPISAQQIAHREPRTAPTNNKKVFRATPVYRNYQGNGLLPARLDSFVKTSGIYAEQIYGGDSANGKPLFDHFTTDHRINVGIRGDRSAGLTTGHGSYLPDAWGADEFTSPGSEFSKSATQRKPNFIPIDPLAKQDVLNDPIGGAKISPLPLPGAEIPPYPIDGKIYRMHTINGRFAGWVQI